MKYGLLRVPALTLALLLSLSPTHAYGISDGVFGKGVQTYISSSDAFLLSRPDRNAHSKPLRIGDLVQIIEKSESTETFKNFKDNFYKARVGKENGFIWGGDLAKAYLSLDQSVTPKMLLVKLDGTANGDAGHSITAEIIQSNKLVSKCNFKAIESPDGQNYRYSMELTPFDQSLSGQPRLFKLKQNLDACDYACGDSILVVTGANIHHGFDAISSVNEQGGSEYKIVGPRQKGGLKNQLTVVHTTSENESGQKQITREVYKWNGKNFVPPPESKEKY